MKISYKGIDFEVEYDYQPEEKQTRDNPRCEEGAEITSLKVYGQYPEMLDIINPQDVMEIEKLILEQHKP